MSLADKIFIQMCKDILENGTSTEGEKVRPHWADGTPAYTVKKFAVVNRYDLSKEFPILTLRKTALKSATEEMLWIWQKKSNNINDLNSHIWDEWPDADGSIGKAYGYQMGVKHQYREGMMDQVDRVIYDLKNNPFSRRIMTNLYVHQDLHEMNLYPCAYSMTFNVTSAAGAAQEKESGKLVLNAGRLEILFKVALPSSLPYLFTGLKVSLSMAWLGIVAAELLASQSGLGYMIQVARSLGRPDLVIVGMLTIGLIGAFLTMALEMAERVFVKGNRK